MTSAPAEAVPLTPFPIASRQQSRLVSPQTVTVPTATDLTPIQITASGWIEAIEIEVNIAVTGTALTVAGVDSPWSYLTRLTLTDSQGRPIIATIDGYSLYLKNKFSDTGFTFSDRGTPNDPRMSPAFAFGQSGGTSGSVAFRLFLIASQDSRDYYGLWPNLDSNANMQLRIGVGALSGLFGGTISTQTSTIRVTQHYWAPAADTMSGAPLNVEPLGSGDFLETRFESPAVNASAENLTQILARGGQIKNIILVSRTGAGVRTAFTPGSQVGLLLDNVPIVEGVTLESWQDRVRKFFGYTGTDPLATGTPYTPLSGGITSGLDTGVLVFPFHAISKFRDSWLGTRGGALLQVRHTPGASATQLQILTDLMQTDDSAAFYNRG
jgi:hypothetical protein